MIGYIEMFDSFKAVQKDAKVFMIELRLISGDVIESSVIPCAGDGGAALNAIAEAFEHAAAAHSFFPIWKKNEKKVVAVAIDEIAAVSIRFV